MFNWLNRSILCVIVVAVFSGAASAETEAWEYSPYRIQVWLTLGPSAELDDRAEARLTKSLMTDIDAMIGAPWKAEVVAPPTALHSEILYDHTFLTPERLKEVAPDVFKLDKVILLTIKTTPREYIIQAREFDCRTQLFGPGIDRIVRQRAYLQTAAFQAMSDAFRAMTRLEEGAPKSAKVRIRAGGLISSNTSPCFVGVGDALLPILRTNDRQGEIRSIVTIEWTYLVVRGRGELSPYLMDCRVWSGKPNPVQGRVTSRKEQYALKVKPGNKISVLRVEARVKRNETPYPMAGLEVYAKLPIDDPPKPEPVEDKATSGEGAAKASSTSEPKAGESETKAEATPTSGEAAPPAEGAESPADGAAGPESNTPAETPEDEPTPNPPILVGVTDWRGMITIEPGEMPMRIFYLKNGGQLLARLPLIPGLQEEFVAQVPDDGPRLQAEGFIKGLQGQLMDVEAQRQIIYARFKMRLEESNVIEADVLYQEFQKLPTKLELIDQLNTQKNIEIDPPPNRVIKARIDNLYKGMSEALGKYLSPKLANQMLTELNLAKRNLQRATTASPAE